MAVRSRSGSQFLELTAGLLVLVPMILYGLDVGVIYIGAAMNSDYCREACRAAANGAPAAFAKSHNTPTPTQRAVEVILLKQKPGPNPILVDPTLVKVTETSVVLPDATFGGPITGVVTVETTVKVCPPLLLPCVPKEVDQVTNQTFPFTWIMPGTTGSSS